MDELTPPLLASQYRRLWLDSEDELGLIAEHLAEALDWTPSAEEVLPDPLQLAEVAASILHQLKLTPNQKRLAQVKLPATMPAKPRHKSRQGSLQSRTFALN